MNEHIRVIADKATCLVEQRPGTGICLTDDLLEKFGELIVMECAQFVEDKFDFIGDEIIVKEKMLEHFGVKR